MGASSSEFQGILTLNKSLVEQLFSYLEDRESKACQAILDVAQTRLPQPSIPSFLPPPAIPLKFSETVELIGKKIRQAIQARQNLTGPSDWREMADKINKTFWEYLEVLEGGVTELFQQLDQVGVEEWSIQLAHIVDAIKEQLMHRLDDLSWAIRRIEQQLQDYRWAGETRRSRWAYLKKMALFWQNALDRALTTNLEKCRKYLGFRYTKFSDQYARYIDIHTAIELVVDRFSECQVFATLDGDLQQKFKKLYRLVRLWQLNLETRALPRRETIRAVRNAMSSERALTLFREYDQHLRRALFNKSRFIKDHKEELSDRGSIHQVQEELAGYRIELHTLSSTISAYRDFLLKSDPGQRGKPQFGFSEWALGPESHEVKQLTRLITDLSLLDQMMMAFGSTLESKGVTPEPSSSSVDPDIQTILHEMAQPLISRISMQTRAEHLVSLLQSVDFLASSDKQSVAYLGQILNKAMKSDWQYHVLFDIPAFHHLYAIYQGLSSPVEDRGHVNRLHKFKRVIQQLEQWVKSHDTPRHAHEIELDLTDLKAYLQDFLAHIQRLSRDESPDRDQRFSEVAQQLLEYRYLFGHFFHQLHGDSMEERILRKQLLFVDQYFEAVENRLQESPMKYGSA